MANKNILALALLILASALPLISAIPQDSDLALSFPHKQNTDLELSFTSNNATSCNLTSFNSPNGFIYLNQESTRSGQTFNNSLEGGNFSSLGIYCFNLVCYDGLNYDTGSICKEITPTGDELNLSEILMYIFASLSTLSLTLLFLYFGSYNFKEGSVKGEKTGFNFFFTGLAFIFLIGHILITSLSLSDVFGEVGITNSYNNVIFVLFTVIFLIFLYTIIKVGFEAVSTIQKTKGLK